MDRFLLALLIASGACVMGWSIYDANEIAFAVGALMVVLGVREVLADAEVDKQGQEKF